ncbi:porin [Caballeronia sp. GAWG1-1]|uniref:porin n=1 Tax=Caballeronia sp. GAWG1-1 TaxID=2921742 RepID=UPI0020280FAA|nr:porin [Caballeronia sp. GAWG1-1]
MRKHLLGAAVPLVVTTAAFAQNSVTLYGIIDEGFAFTNNAAGHQAWQFQSGWVAGSRWGLKGAEDLGNGVKAIFTLENGFDNNNGRLGQGGREFGRQAYVGLQSTPYGTVTLGRQYDSVVDYLAPLTSNGSTTGFIFAHPLDNDNTDNTFRVNNAVKFSSINYGGVKFGGMYAFSNQAGGFSNNREYSVGVTYTGAALSLGAAYLQANNPGGNANGALAGDDTNFVASRQQIWGGGINYTWEAASVGFVYTHTTVDSPTASVYVGAFNILPSSLKFDNFEVNGKYQFTPAFFLTAMYTYTKGTFDASSGTSKPKWHQAAVMADYALSKRTDVYFQAAYQHVAGDTTGTALDQAQVPGAAGMSSTTSQVVARVGLKHAF